VPEQWLEAYRGIHSRPRTPQLLSLKRCLPLLLVVACESGTGSFTGNLRVTATTSGGDLDLNGYIVRVDDVQRATLTPNGVAVITDLATGNHAIALSDVASNCSPSATNPSAAIVPALAETTTVAFAIACVVTGVHVTTATTGLDLDSDGYTVQIGGTTAPTAVAASGTVVITRLTAGSQSVTLRGLAANCSVSGDNPQSVTLVTGEVITVAFQVSCVATSGVIEVAAATTGIDLDANGYTVQAGNTQLPLPINGTIRFTERPSGDHSVTLSGLSANCTVAGDNPRTIQVTTGGLTRDTARTTFEVTCTSNTGSLRIATTTTGGEFDPNGYYVAVDEYCYYYYYYGNYCNYTWEGTLGVNDAVTLPNITIGDHTVIVRDVARNCTVASPNPRTVTVPSAGLVEAAFAISCVPRGSLAVTVATTGVDPDPNGYVLTFDGTVFDTSATIASSGSTTVQLMPGDYNVRLSGVTLNCEITSPHPVNASVVSNNTVSVNFTANCVAAKQLAFVSQADGNDEIYLVKSNGTGLTRLTMNTVSDRDPAWTADGLRLAFASNRDGNAEIYTMNSDGQNVLRLTNQSAADYQPTWSPDGSKIAFVSERDGHAEIYVMNATDGSSQVRLTTDGVTPTPDGDPAWSPDGAKIAFWSTRSGTAEIWVMDADGSNPTKLTSTGENYQPAWSPDGQKLVFRHTSSCYYWCDYDLWVVNISGLATTKLPTADFVDTDPHWSSDGAWIAYATASCDYYNCSSPAIAAVRSDGTRTVEIVPAPAFSPAWRP